MARPRKEKPNRSDQRYEVKITIGHGLDGKPIRKSFYSHISKDDAKKQADEYRINKKASAFAGVVLPTESVNFKEWAEHWLRIYKEKTVRASTYKNTYCNTVHIDLIPYFGKAQLSSISPTDVQAFFNTRHAASKSKLDKIRTCLNGIFETAIDNGLCARNPVRGVKIISTALKEKKRAYSSKDATKLLEYAVHSPDGLGIVLLLELGIRRGELLALNWDDVNIDTKIVSISKTVSIENGRVVIGPPKTDSSIRELPLSLSIATYLSKLKKTGLIFPNSVGQVFDPHNWKKRVYDPFMQRAAHDLQIPILNPHELRHTCGTLLYAKTKNIFAVSKFLGHASVDITARIYVHNDVEVLRDSLNI